MNKIIRRVLIAILISVAFVLMLSTSSKMAVRLDLLLWGNPIYAIESNPYNDKDAAELFPHKKGIMVYSVSPKYSIDPFYSTGDPLYTFIIHKYWIFKVAEPTMTP
ncbi:hypothetical protein [Lentilactobacillus sp. SPB1-3]|uniref:Uncharacterized protein n=1 Tax=Lentilactobacillus terminaliae TaxID=3003483 RepID=A0ACD5DGT7_9LACO|nr:hypothetical protein [Lentilactobacillus sp. SPB1-3]MCZ0976902.1 hypothetical protein [Lentilactobacillus sp. SPB1-3]